MQAILYCHRESGHSYKTALALTLIGVPFEQRPVDLNLPCEHLFWADQADVDLAPWPAVGAWLDRIHSLPRWQSPYDLLEDRFPIRPGTRT